jgi:hypothetical protein
MTRSSLLVLTFASVALPSALIAQQGAAPGPRGQVIFHRSDEQAEAERTPAAQASRPSKTPRTPEKTLASITDAERSAIALGAWDLDLHIAPATSALRARAHFTITNRTSAPLHRFTLQLSSTLHWESLAASAPLRFTEHPLLTDADHTGQATEILVGLPEALAPGKSLQLNGFYAGEIPSSGERLLRIGAPAEQAAHADWDQISAEGTALRGFGNVLWYPVSSPPLFLGDGAKLFQAIGRSRLEQAASTMRLRLTVEYVGEPPVDAFFDGQRYPLSHTTEEPDVAVAQSHGVAVAEVPSLPIGFRTPSLFVTSRATRPSENQLLSVVTDRPEAIAPYTAASNNVAPLLKDWLGETPLSPLTILDHPGEPFEDSALLVVPLAATDARQIAPAMSHSLTHAWFRSSLPWLNEGVPQFMALLYSESTQGRDRALAELREIINPLTLAEPELPASAARKPAAEGVSTSSSSPSISAEPKTSQPAALPSTQPPPPGEVGQSLIAAHDEIYYRAKSAAVLWMLRSLVGDAVLKQTLNRYREQARQVETKSSPEDPRAFEHVLEEVAERAAGQVSAVDSDSRPAAGTTVKPRTPEETHRMLTTLFDDWVYTDRGLADLSIVNVTPRDLPARSGKGVSWLVAVEIRNDGAVSVDVPVTVRSGTLTSTERVHLDPHSSTSTRILFEGTPEEVQLNDGTIPETTEPIHVRQLNLTTAPSR